MHLKPSTLTFLLIILINLNFSVSSAQNQASLRKREWNLENGVALKGYDPVAYFDQQKSIKGNKSYIFNSEGVLYYFSTALNLEKFKKNPSSFQPQYGGWCAYAMGDSGHKVEVDPETFKIVNGKLYLFYHTFFNNTLKTWNEKETELKQTADINWKKFIK